MNIKYKIILTIIAIIIIIGLIYLYAYFFGRKGLITKEYKVEVNSFVSEYDGYKIAHISDLHYGNHMSIENVDKLVEQVNSLKPDLIFITGDLVDDKITSAQHNELVKSLSKLKANVNKYIVNGNHDTYYKNFDKLISDINFINLNDTSTKIYLSKNNFIFIAGISDSIFNNKDIKDRYTEIENELKKEDMTDCVLKLLIMHEPDYIDEIDYSNFDVILCGHSHNGQVRIPFIGSIYEPIGSKKYYKEYYKLDNTNLYISSGVGVSWLPIRLFNKPSFNLYRIAK